MRSRRPTSARTGHHFDPGRAVLTDAAKELIAQRDQQRAERIAGTRPMFDTAYTLGDFRLAEPGCEVWSKTDGDLADVKMNPDGDPCGGIVLEVTTSVDDVDGEIRRAFRCFDYTRTQLWRAVIVLQEHQVDPDSFSPPDWSRIRAQYRRICREIGGRRGVASRPELELMHDAHLLAAIVSRTVAA